MDVYSKGESDGKIKQTNLNPNIECSSSSATVTKIYGKVGRSQSLWVINCKFTYAYTGETDPEFVFVGGVYNKPKPNDSIFL